MNFSPVFLQQFKNCVERILHVKGNYDGGILEMAVVLDHNLPKKTVLEAVPQLLRSLKMHSEVFRNVRLNVVDWSSDDGITNKVSPMAMLLMESYYSDYEMCKSTKKMRVLVDYLKLFQARAKLIILMTDGNMENGDEEELKQAMQPFLGKKLMQVIFTKEGIKISYR